MIEGAPSCYLVVMMREVFRVYKIMVATNSVVHLQFACIAISVCKANREQNTVYWFV